MPPAVPATLETYLCTEAITGTFEFHSSVPKTSPAGTVTEVTSGKNFVSRGNRTMGAELTAAPAAAPLATAGWKVSVTDAFADASGLNSQRSVRFCALPAAGPRPTMGNQPLVEAGE